MALKVCLPPVSPELGSINLQTGGGQNYHPSQEV